MDQPVSFFEQLRDFLRRNASWFLCAALGLLLLQDVFGTHGLISMRQSQQQAAEVQKEINQINSENQALQGSVKALKSDPASIERIAREDMGLARPGEYIFKIPAKPGDPSTLAASPSGLSKP